jgi:hypothetical protein
MAKQTVVNLEPLATHLDKVNSNFTELYGSKSDENFTTILKTKLDWIEAWADVTDATNVNAAGAVMNSDYGNHSILVKQWWSWDPVSLSVGTNTLVGRLSWGGSEIDGLSTSQVKTMLSLNNVDNTSDATKNSATATLTNKTINLWSNTLITTAAQFQAAMTDNDVALINGGNNFSGTQTYSWVINANWNIRVENTNDNQLELAYPWHTSNKLRNYQWDL